MGASLCNFPLDYVMIIHHTKTIIILFCCRFPTCIQLPVYSYIILYSLTVWHWHDINIVSKTIIVYIRIILYTMSFLL